MGWIAIRGSDVLLNKEDVFAKIWDDSGTTSQSWLEVERQRKQAGSPRYFIGSEPMDIPPVRPDWIEGLEYEVFVGIKG